MSTKGPQIRRDGWHYAHCWRAWAIRAGEAKCICSQEPGAEWYNGNVDEGARDRILRGWKPSTPPEGRPGRQEGRDE